MSETWRRVIKYEMLYEVSNMGRVRSVPKRGSRGKIIAQIINRTGYPAVRLSNIRLRWECVHQLVADAFLRNGPRPANRFDGPEVNHIDGVKTNNLLTNLELVTPRQNRIHASKMGLLKYAKVKTHQVPLIRRQLVNHTTAEVARINGLTWKIVKDIKSGRTWFHVPPE